MKKDSQNQQWGGSEKVMDGVKTERDNKEQASIAPL